MRLALARAALVPALLVLAYLDEERWLALAVGGLLLLDLARERTGQEAAAVDRFIGRFTDLAALASLPLALSWSRPRLLGSEPEAYWILVAAITLPAAAYFIKYGRIALHGTRLARWSGWLVQAAVLGFLYLGASLAVAMAALAMTAAALEQLALTALLPAPADGATSVPAALRRWRELRASRI